MRTRTWGSTLNTNVNIAVRMTVVARDSRVRRTQVSRHRPPGLCGWSPANIVLAARLATSMVQTANTNRTDSPWVTAHIAMACPMGLIDGATPHTRSRAR